MCIYFRFKIHHTKISMNYSYSRVCFAGEDLDWTQGKSLLCNINLKTSVIIQKLDSPNDVIEINSNLIDYTIRLFPCDFDSHIYSNNKYDYIIAAIKVFKRHFYIIKNINIYIKSDIPVKSGLSSSAALLTCFFKELYNFYNIKYTIDQICNLCFETEYLELKCQVGKMDFYSCCAHGIIMYESKKESVIYKKLNTNGLKIILIYCGLSSSTKKINKNKLLRYQYKEYNFMQYLKYGNSIVGDLSDEIKENGDIEKIGYLISQYHDIIDKYLNVSTSYINEIVSLCNSAGAYGSKLTGCGLGGYVFSLIEENKAALLIDTLQKNSIKYILTDPVCY